MFSEVSVCSQGGLCWGGSVWMGCLSRDVCLGSFYLGGLYMEGSLSGDLCPGGVSVSETTLVALEERAVRILLECILVLNMLF